MTKAQTGTLLQHGLDFINRAAESLLPVADKQPRFHSLDYFGAGSRYDNNKPNVKYALIDFWTGLEFVFHHKLYELNPILQFGNIDDSEIRRHARSLLEAPIGLQKQVNRLTNLDPYFPPGETSDDFLRSLNNVIKMRNGLFVSPSTIISYPVALSSLSQILNVLAKDDHYLITGEDLSPFLEPAKKLNAGVATIWNSIRDDLCARNRDGKFIFRCPQCHQTASYILENDPDLIVWPDGTEEDQPPFLAHCLFCDHALENTGLYSHDLLEENTADPPVATDNLSKLYLSSSNKLFLGELEDKVAGLCCARDSSIYSKGSKIELDRFRYAEDHSGCDGTILGVGVGYPYPTIYACCFCGKECRDDTGNHEEKLGENKADR